MAAPVDPPAPTPEVEATPAPAAPQPGPWAADAAEYFGDNPEAIAAFDRYMREKQQPARTQFEQETAPARELYKDLLEDPTGTLSAVVEHFYGEDVASKFGSLFGDEEAEEVEETPAPPAADDDDVPEWAKPLLAAHETQTEQQAREESDAIYQEELTKLRAAHPDLTDHDVDVLIHPFIAGPGGGDPEAGYQALAAWKQQAGLTAPAAEEAPAPPTAPPVLGTQAAPAAAPPVSKKYTSIDDALDDYFAENRPSAPPVVGSA